MPVLIYHNETCSKSRGVLDILNERGIAFTVINYIAEPLKSEELSNLLNLLQVNPSVLVRTKEPLFQKHYGGLELSEEQYLEALLKYPELMERPVVLNGDRAIIARPPELVLDIL